MKDENLEDFNFDETEACDCHDHNCGCAEGKECSCGDDCKCHDEGDLHKHKCHCKEDEHECNCEHDEHCDCGCHGDESLVEQYLALAQHLQADFDNYRRHVAEQLDYQREEGKKSVLSVFLPCLDTFKDAKKNISDESVLAGINMIENKILDALKSLKVEKIETIGNKFDHNLHEVIAVMKDETKENDVILDEFQAGYTLNGRVIRYSKVIVNKLD